MSKDRSSKGEFTGRHMLMIMLAFFGVIITVNLIMATLANTTWSGIVVKNSYIASREFNTRAEEARRQEALAWTADFRLDDGRLSFTIADAEGRPVPLHGGTATLRRAVNERDDMTVVLKVAGDALEGAAEVADGAWIVDIVADAGRDVPYRETRRIHVQEGSVR